MCGPTWGPEAPTGPPGPGAPASPLGPVSPDSPLAPGWPSAPWGWRARDKTVQDMPGLRCDTIESILICRCVRFLQEVQRIQQVQQVRPLHGHPVEVMRRESLGSYSHKCTMDVILLRNLDPIKSLYHQLSIRCVCVCGGELTGAPRGPVGPATPRGPGSP